MLANTVTAFLLTCQAEGKSAQTIRWYEGKLRLFQDWHGDGPVTLERVRAFAVHLQVVKVGEKNAYVPLQERVISPYTVKGYMETLKVFANFCQREGYEVDPRVALMKMPKVPSRMVQVLTPEEQLALLGLPRVKTKEGSRDLAIFSLLLDTGIRVGELVTIQVAGIDLHTGSLRVIGKGNKERQVQFGKRTTKTLIRWLAVKPKGAALFPGLTVGAVQQMVNRYKVRASLPHLHPHLFRHTFAVSFLRHGGNALYLMRLLGHTTMNMTNHYVSVSEADMGEAYRRSSPLDHL